LRGGPHGGRKNGELLGRGRGLGSEKRDVFIKTPREKTPSKRLRLYKLMGTIGIGFERGREEDVGGGGENSRLQ